MLLNAPQIETITQSTNIDGKQLTQDRDDVGQLEAPEPLKISEFTRDPHIAQLQQQLIEEEETFEKTWSQLTDAGNTKIFALIALLCFIIALSLSAGVFCCIKYRKHRAAREARRQNWGMLYLKSPVQSSPNGNA